MFQLRKYNNKSYHRTRKLSDFFLEKVDIDGCSSRALTKNSDLRGQILSSTTISTVQGPNTFDLFPANWPIFF